MGFVVAIRNPASAIRCSIMPRKPISQLTPAEAEARREYNREAKRKSRAKLGAEKDKRTYADRAEYLRNKQREYRKRRAEKK